MSSVVLTPVTEAGHWRVKMEWLNSRHAPRYFGKFNSKSEAEKWIDEHHSLTTQREDAQ